MHPSFVWEVGYVMSGVYRDLVIQGFESSCCVLHVRGLVPLVLLYDIREHIVSASSLSDKEGPRRCMKQLAIFLEFITPCVEHSPSIVVQLFLA